jgi:hypothetical protein
MAVWFSPTPKTRNALNHLHPTDGGAFPLLSFIRIKINATPFILQPKEATHPGV